MRWEHAAGRAISNAGNAFCNGRSAVTGFDGMVWLVFHAGREFFSI